MKSIYRLAAAGAALVALSCAAPAYAADPVSVPPGSFVLDQADVLTDAEEGMLNDRIAELQKNDGHALYVVYVDTFTDPQDAQKWLGKSAEKTGLLSTDSMLAIAVESRKAQFESHARGKIAKYDDDIFTKNIRPELSEGQWGEAGVAAADGISAAKAGLYAKKSSNTVAAAPREPINPMPILVSIGAVAGTTGLGIGGYFLYGSIKRRRKDAADKAAFRASIDEAAAEAAGLIIDASSKLADGEERLSFILAEYGEHAEAAARKVFNEATFKLDQALDLQRICNENTENPDKNTLRDWRSASSAARTAMNLSEKIEAEAKKFLKDVAGATLQASALMTDVKRGLKNSTTLQSMKLSRGERPSSYLEAGKKAAHLAADLFDRAQAGLNEVTNTPAGYAKLLVAQAVTGEALAAEKEVTNQFHKHAMVNGQVVDLEKNMVETSRMASKLGNHRHPELAGIAKRVMAEAKLLDTSAMDAETAYEKLAKIAQPMMRAVSTAKEVENEIAHARRAFPIAVNDARAAIEKASRYISRNSDASSNLPYVSAATRSLEAAEAAGHGEDLREALKAVENAMAGAKRALSEAKEDVRRAERRRADARRASSYSSSSSSSSFGYSSSFSSSSFDSGSSSGFGSGGSGGSFSSDSGSGGSF